MEGLEPEAVRAVNLQPTNKMNKKLKKKLWKDYNYKIIIYMFDKFLYESLITF